jgi:hypothetical protein
MTTYSTAAQVATQGNIEVHWHGTMLILIDALGRHYTGFYIHPLGDFPIT